MAACVWTESQIVPDLVDSLPDVVCELRFPSGAVAILGAVLTPTVVPEKPNVSFHADATAYYTIISTATLGCVFPFSCRQSNCVIYLVYLVFYALK
jgi:hypothetical protein